MLIELFVPEVGTTSIAITKSLRTYHSSDSSVNQALQDPQSTLYHCVDRCGLVLSRGAWKHNETAVC